MEPWIRPVFLVGQKYRADTVLPEEQESLDFADGRKRNTAAGDGGWGGVSPKRGPLQKNGNSGGGGLQLHQQLHAGTPQGAREEGRGGGGGGDVTVRRSSAPSSENFRREPERTT